MAPISIALSNTLNPPPSSIDGRAPLRYPKQTETKILKEYSQDRLISSRKVFVSGYLLSKTFANVLFPDAMQWCNGVLP